MIIRHLPRMCHPDRDMRSIDGALIHFMSNVYRKPDDPFNLDDIMGLFAEYRVSAHFLIDRLGQPIELLPLPKEAFHAGKSRMGGRNRCNKWTIGIELMGGTDFPYLEAQIVTLTNMLASFMTEYRFPVEYIQGHDDVRTAWNREYPTNKGSKKVDPGPHFPFERVRSSLKTMVTR